ncbi:MAG: MurT ligase domain-containing protein [Firmicutes bacterium]|nr:MurT ligase domain-containing protein [Bacillota bacterium]
MANMRLWLAVLAGRMAGWISRLTGRGGSSLPGLVARKIDPRVLEQLSRQIPQGVALITGTNGKTTTAAIAAHILKHAGQRIIYNRAGANLILGLTATLLQSGRKGIQPQGDLALLETDEATMPRAAREMHPRLIVVTNFFRDQLDRYGELSTTVKFVASGIEGLAPGGWLVLNADDPQAAYLGSRQGHVRYFGVDLPEELLAMPEDHAAYDIVDARFCPRCGHPLDYERRYYAHIGWYACASCGWQRPEPDFTVTGWDSAQGMVTIQGPEHETRQIVFPMLGIYNIYNLVAAVAAAAVLHAPFAVAEEAMTSFKPAFGRMEWINWHDAPFWLALVKNPVGFNQVLQAMGQDVAEDKQVLIIINDRYADGQDVSWLWDVDFETWQQRSRVQQWWVSGLRAYDMAVRLKYAGVDPQHIHIVQEPSQAVKDMAQSSQSTTVNYVMPTYTALLEIREFFAHEGVVRHFREG